VARGFFKQQDGDRISLFAGGAGGNPNPDCRAGGLSPTMLAIASFASTSNAFGSRKNVVTRDQEIREEVLSFICIFRAGKQNNHPSSLFRATCIRRSTRRITVERL